MDDQYQTVDIVEELIVDIDDSQKSQMILNGAKTAFLNRQVPSLPDCRSMLLTNDYTKGRKVITDIEKELENCVSFSFSVAFVTLGGITPLLPYLKRLEAQGVPGRILTTDYLSFNDPRALEKLASFSNIQLKMFKTQESGNSLGFHTKGYLFERQDGTRHAIIGSSNLTDSALMKNKEWNLKLVSTSQGELIQDAFNEFEDLWAFATALEDYLDAYKQLFVEKKRLMAKEQVLQYDSVRLEPNSMQIQFIQRLDRLRAEGAKRALLISATGTGKTYAAAFAVRHMDPKRVLFLAHREQLLEGAESSFQRVYNHKLDTTILSGTRRFQPKGFVFAMAQSLQKDEYLQRFDPDYFDVIVVDEAHHVGSDGYQKILNHFRPEFMLGMTATPERSDGFDVYAFFHNNIAHEIRLQQALEENLLCPFHYFGVADVEVDGKPIDDFANLNSLSSDQRVDHVLRHAQLLGYSGKRLKGLIFCSNVEESGKLSEKLNERGLRTLALDGSDAPEVRNRAIQRLVCDEGSPLYEERLDYILTVGIFNEGVDIPDVNQIIMLRPTQSAIVFVQQLGRGLRKAPDKDFVVVIDFIGNYKKSFLIPVALCGDRSYKKDRLRRDVLEGSKTLPGVSTIYFDQVTKSRIFQAIDNANNSLRFLSGHYQELKAKLGRIPTMMDFQEFGDIDPLLFVESSKGSYYAFLQDREKAYEGHFDADALAILNCLSDYVARGQRIYEPLILNQLIETGQCDLEQTLVQFRAACSETEDSFSRESYASALRVLNGSFKPAQGARILKDSSDDVEVCHRISPRVAQLLENRHFKAALQDIVALGVTKYLEDYASNNHGFKHYQVYTRETIQRLLNWDKLLQGGQMVSGYPVINGEKSIPIFITYQKDENIDEALNYADKFINKNQFLWQSTHGHGLRSASVSKIINAKEWGYRLLLFIKKSDNRELSYYYIGDVVPTVASESTIQNKGKQEAIANVLFVLDQPVRDDIYDYLVS